MNAYEVIEDATNNPFVADDEVETVNNTHEEDGEIWDANMDVATTRVYEHIRKAIARLNFYLRHPLLGEEMDEEHAIHLRSELRRYTSYLNKAHYN